MKNPLGTKGRTSMFSYREYSASWGASFSVSRKNRMTGNTASRRGLKAAPPCADKEAIPVDLPPASLKTINLNLTKGFDYMKTIFERYKELNINGSLICLEQVEDIYSYFCYPTNAKAIGFEGSIMYCFIKPYGNMVFACNPETCADVFVYPLARTFEDFMRLILACGSANSIEQIVWMDKDKFAKHLKEEEAIRTKEQKAVISYLEKELGISPIDNPYDYVKELQTHFDNSGIEYSDEYYDVLGIERE